MSEAWDPHIASFCRFGIIWSVVGLLTAPIALELDGTLCALTCDEPAGQVLVLAVDIVGILGLGLMCLGLHGAVFFRRHQTLIERSIRGAMPTAPWDVDTDGAELWPVYRRSVMAASFVLGLLLGTPLMLSGPLVEVGWAVVGLTWGFSLVLLAWPLWQRIWRMGATAA